MSQRMAINMAGADLSESLLEVNLSSIQKSPQDTVEGSEEGVLETVRDAIRGLCPGEALVIWVK